MLRTLSRQLLNTMTRRIALSAMCALNRPSFAFVTSLKRPTLQQLYKMKPATSDTENPRCDGCDTRLQTYDKERFGFIEAKAMTKILQQNQQLLRNSFSGYISNQNSKVLDFLHQTELELGIPIFDSESKSVTNLDDVRVLLALQDKLDQYERDHQTLTRTERNRTQLLCLRCYSLKYQNRLLDEYDSGSFDIPTTELMDKVIKRHKGLEVVYIYLVDAMDVLGTLNREILTQIMKANSESRTVVAINKHDIFNKQYIDPHAVLKQVKQLLVEWQLGTIIDVLLLSGKTHEGFKRLFTLLKDVPRIQLIGYPNTGKTTLLNALARTQRSVSRYPGTTVAISEHHYRSGQRIFDMPGLHDQKLLYNLIDRPSQRALLTWQKHFSPGILTHNAFIFGGRIEATGVRLVVCGLGGACTASNQWFVMNRTMFWKGLPDPKVLKITKRDEQVEFRQGKGPDLEIAGYGFIGLSLCQPSSSTIVKNITLYLPQQVSYRFRSSVVIESRLLHSKSTQKKRFMLERLVDERKKEEKSTKQRKKQIDNIAQE